MQTDDTHAAAASMDSASASAAPSAPITAAAAPTLRRSGQSHASSSDAGSAGSKRSSAAAAAALSSPCVPSTSDCIGEEEGQATDSPAASAAAAASAPSSKRARSSKLNAAASSSAASSPSSLLQLAQSSPMIRILSRDTGAQFALCEMLGLRNIGRLHRSCRSWRRWLDDGSYGSSRLLHLKDRVPLGLCKSVWAPRYVQRLVLGPLSKASVGFTPAAAVVEEAALDEPPAQCEDGRLEQIALRLLPHLNRLRALQLIIRLRTQNSIALPPKLPLASATLLALELDVRFWAGNQSDPFTAAFLRSISGVPSLTSLHITSDRIDKAFNELDFSALPSLTQLQSLSVIANDDVRCSPAQVDAMIACRALTSLDVGVWGPVDVLRYPLSTRAAAQLDADLNKLMRGRNLNGAARLRTLGLGRWVGKQL